MVIAWRGREDSSKLGGDVNGSLMTVAKDMVANGATPSI